MNLFASLCLKNKKPNIRLIAPVKSYYINLCVVYINRLCISKWLRKLTSELGLHSLLSWATRGAISLNKAQILNNITFVLRCRWLFSAGCECNPKRRKTMKHVRGETLWEILTHTHHLGVTYTIYIAKCKRHTQTHAQTPHTHSCTISLYPQHAEHWVPCAFFPFYPFRQSNYNGYMHECVYIVIGGAL